VVAGLNRKLAVAIVKARPFRSLDDLVRVRGIGDKTVRRLRAVLTV
jgi:DNA uptake protein ComE-like DNA-binding protein